MGPTSRAGALHLGWAILLIAACESNDPVGAGGTAGLPGPGGSSGTSGAGGTAGAAGAGGTGSCAPVPRVTTTADTAKGSLRAAVTAANAACEPVTIELDPGVYELTACGNDDDSNGLGDLDITAAAGLKLVGKGGEVVIRQTCENQRVIDVMGGGPLRLEGLTISGGSIATESAPAEGGGVRASGDVWLERAVVTENEVDGAVRTEQHVRGGGLYVAGSLTAVDSTISANVAKGRLGEFPTLTEPLDALHGGGAYVAKAVTVSGGRVAGNRVTGDPMFSARGAGIAQAVGAAEPVTLSDVTFEDNVAQGGDGEGPGTASAGDAEGGALAASGDLVATRVTVKQNAALGGDSSHNLGLGHPGGDAWGGGFAAERAEITASVFSANQAVGGPSFRVCEIVSCKGAFAGGANGGALFAQSAKLVDSTFEGNSIDNGGSGPAGAFKSGPGGGAVAAQAELEASHSRFESNESSGTGGALLGATVSLADCILRKNHVSGTSSLSQHGSPGSGGAVQADTLVADRIEAVENDVEGLTGGALNVTGDAIIRSSKILNNQLRYTVTIADAVEAGGAGVFVAGSLSISDSTIAGNRGSAMPVAPANSGSGLCLAFVQCVASFGGGGVRAGSVDARNVTFSDNHAEGLTTQLTTPVARSLRSGGGAIFSDGDVSLLNATLSNNGVTGRKDAASGLGAALIAGALSLDHVTIVDNAGERVVELWPVDAPVGPVASLQATVLTAHRSVVIAPAGARVCATGTHTAGAANSSYNWFSDPTCALQGASDRQNTVGITLNPLTDNGGAMQTRLPALGSQLVDFIPLPACTSASDARGVVRPQGAACDVGAVEVAP